MRHNRSALAALAATAAAFLVVGCSSSDGSSGSQDSGSPAATARSTTGGGDSSAGSGTGKQGGAAAAADDSKDGGASAGGSQSGEAGAPQDEAHDDHLHGSGSLCEAPPVDVKLTGYRSADGFSTMYVVLKNEGNHPCHTQGYLGLQWDKGGQKVPASVVRGLEGPTDNTAKALELASFDTAYGVVQWAGTVACPKGEQTAPDQVEITLPDSFRQTKLTWPNGPVCAQQEVHVGPLNAGDAPVG